MFLHNVDKSKLTMYNKSNLIWLRFASMYNENIDVSKGYPYRCDQEFLDYLCAFGQADSITSTGINNAYDNKRFVQYTFIIEKLPDEIQGLLRMNPDVAEAFKAYLDDPKLDRLCKD